MRSIWDILSFDNAKGAVKWLIPLRFIAEHFFFHSSVEEDVEDFLNAKCVSLEEQMSEKTRQSLKLQMQEFMNHENSIPLADFVYQLQYYV